MRISDFYKCKKGATAIEYVLLAAMFALICIGAAMYLKDNTSNMYSNIASSVESANSKPKPH